MRMLLALTVLLVPTIASADEYGEPTRFGVFGGVAVHGGHISCEGAGGGDDFRKAGGADGHIGWLFDQKVGLMLDLWGMTSKENDTTISYVAATVNVRYWVAPILWLQGGIGYGHANVKVETAIGDFEGQTDDVPVAQLGLGVEVARGTNWAFDVEAKVAQGTDTDGSNASTGRMVGIGVGLTFFGSK
jgi:hypothetical protein